MYTAVVHIGTRKYNDNYFVFIISRKSRGDTTKAFVVITYNIIICVITVLRFDFIIFFFFFWTKRGTLLFVSPPASISLWYYFYTVESVVLLSCRRACRTGRRLLHYIITNYDCCYYTMFAVHAYERIRI